VTTIYEEPISRILLSKAQILTGWFSLEYQKYRQRTSDGRCLQKMQAPRLSTSALTNNIPKKTLNPAIAADVRTDGAIDQFYRA
jgi:hypothetical protein